MPATTLDQDSDAIISALTKRVKELETENNRLKSLRETENEEVKQLKAELATSKEMMKSMQKVCAYMTRAVTKFKSM